MAEPTDSTTTVNGRRCTRTRVRSSAATSTQLSIVSSSTTSTTSTSTDLGQATSSAIVISSAAAVPLPPPPPAAAASSSSSSSPPPPPPPVSSTVVSSQTVLAAATSAAPNVASIPSSTQTPGVIDPESVDGALSATSSSPAPPSIIPGTQTGSFSSLAATLPAPLPAAPAVPLAPAAAVPSAGGASQVPRVSSVASVASVASVPAAVSVPATPSSVSTSLAVQAQNLPSSTVPTAVPSISQTSSNPIESAIPVGPSGQVQATTTANDPSQTGAGSAGLISPLRGGAGSSSASATAAAAASNGGGGSGGSSKAIGLAVGGAVAGAISIFIIIALVVIFFRKRRENRWSFGDWKQQMDEKQRSDEGNGKLGAQLQNWVESLRSRTGGAFGFFSARFSKPGDEQRARNIPSQASDYSRPSTRASQRSRSASAPPANFGDRIVGSFRGLKDKFRGVRGGPPSIGRPSSPYTGNISGPIGGRRVSNPFPDDTRRQTLHQGLSNQQRPPITPIQQTIVSRPKPLRDPFADPTGVPSGTPEYLRGKKHVRKNSEPLRSNPPNRSPLSNMTVMNDMNAQDFYLGTTTPNNPFADPVEPSRATKPPPPPPAHVRSESQSSGSFILLSNNRDSSSSNINVKPPRLSNGESRDSTASAGTEILFGEPGPSRPNTGMYTPFTPFTPFTPHSRAFKGKSDPFDLDRPEVLSFGEVNGKKEVRGSVTRMNSKHNRHSSTPGWGTLDQIGAELGAASERGSNNFSMPRRPDYPLGGGGLGAVAESPGKAR